MTVVSGRLLRPVRRLSAAGAPDAITGVPNYLWQINTTLFLFNMIPALPLDGGRVLRSALWHRGGNFARATVTAGASRGCSPAR